MVYMGEKAKSKSVFSDILWRQQLNWLTDRQREAVPKRWGARVKSSSTSTGLDPWDWQTIIIVWSQWTGRNQCSQHGMKINRLFFTQGFVGQQIDLKKYSNPTGQPMKRTKQWNTASKWRRLCQQAGELILIKSPSFGLLSPLTHAQMCWLLQTPERSYKTYLM